MNQNHNQKELISRISRIHFDCYKLSKLSFGKYFENSGNMGVFCQTNVEYQNFLTIKEAMTEYSDNPSQKYFKLKNPIIIPAKEDIPVTTYDYLYIRRPDTTEYGKFTGDVDFFVKEDLYQELITSVKKEEVKNASIYNYDDKVLIQLTNKSLSAVGYISTREITEYMRVRH